MATKIVRYSTEGGPAQWGVVHSDAIAPLRGIYQSTRELLLQGQVDIREAEQAKGSIALQGVRVLSPITVQQQFLCQGINYESHVRESGLDLRQFPFNTLFTKASSSLCGAHDAIVRPSHVRLLDYEIELGVVLARDINSPQTVNANALHEYLCGVTIINDISARDVQLPQTQFYKGKSYRTFGPAGPFLVLLSAAEWKRWPELHMTLKVNGVVRQNAMCGEMIHQPAATLTEFSGMHDLQAGDVIATGTPAGCAARAPSKAIAWIAKHFLSDQAKWQAFINAGQKNPAYLQPGDELRLAIRTDDGLIDLGEQVNKIVGA
ncbi:fumarylacetoacetate hydrolase family protein [Curvibacter sp. APW13]|uniref:fumarylacetoacetate hydrolase family protein n=1 Tax=Curvibacter sp. APW13 TaxID=3077236 RepID=UPI0028DDDC9B|nr:fumarylacetoacetate hydrolase family protein [Curvibacter sp. APW13]MDT8989366.1 fumarylacetoacetate hydrolase family protein [Curvibacter sp. APW13]